MATITKKLQLHWSTACYDSDDPWVLFCTDMSEYGYVRVGNVDVTCDVPDNFDPREPQIAMLEQKKEQLTNEFHAEVTRIETEISKLKAIEYTGA
jgi:GH35 family endo-1,4-beta-xylanase